MRQTRTDWGFENTYASELEGFYLDWTPTQVPAPNLVLLNEELADELDVDPAMLRTPAAIDVLAGRAVAEGSTPVAQAYAGHQFGHYSPMLGDGRAALLGELIDTAGRRRDVALKGSGRTQFSRGGDGKATLAAVLREYIVGESMHALGVPTTRALAAVSTGEVVPRDAQAHPGAVLTRVAASHLRVGTFEFVARNGSSEHLQRIADYAMARHYPELARGDYGGFLSEVVRRQAELIAAWVSVGFIHGVMNTDNMTISGETIDYGPCAFLEAYDVDQVFSSIDTGGRYRYGQQPVVAAWNLARFAETLVPLMADRAGGDDAVADATRRVEAFGGQYESARLGRFRAKLGLDGEHEADAELIDDLLLLMAQQRLDFTLTFRRLAQSLRSDTVREGVAQGAAYDAWRRRWLDRLAIGGATEATGRYAIADAMDAVNPIYLARNHHLEAALAAATAGDLVPSERLLHAVRSPFVERAEFEQYGQPAPDGFTDTYRTFCGT